MLSDLLLKILETVFKLLGRVTPERRVLASGALGSFLFAFDRKHRRIALENLSRAFGSEKSRLELEEISRRVFRNMVLLLFEIGWYIQLKPWHLPRCFDVHGLHHLRSAARKGRGVLLLGAHMGSWELLAAVAALTSVPLNMLYRPLDNPVFDKFFWRSRTRFGGRVIPNTKGAMRKIVRSLSRGEMVGMLLDQNVDWYEGVFVDFFGSAACTNKGLAQLALHTGAPVVPGFLFREGGRFEIRFGPEIPLYRSGDPTRDIETNTERYNREIEEAVRRHPDQWFWVHQRWKTRPYQPWPRRNEP